MKRLIRDLLLLATGAAIGSGVTYVVIKNKLNKQAETDEWNQERSERLKFDAMNPPEPPEEEQVDEETAERIRKLHEKPDISKVASEYHEYHDYTKHYKTETPVVNPEEQVDVDAVEEDEDDEEEEYDDLMIPETPRENRRPYQVLRERFGAFESYDQAILHYYSDDVLTDDDGEVVDVDNFVGRDAIDALKESEENEIFVCNPRYACYYNVLLELVPFFSDEE
jgi:hypothetical protein